MSARPRTRWQVDELEPRIAPATWTVVSPGTHEVVVVQTVPSAAAKGLTNAAERANEALGVVCWILQPDRPPGQ